MKKLFAISAAALLLLTACSGRKYEPVTTIAPETTSAAPSSAETTAAAAKPEEAETQAAKETTAAVGETDSDADVLHVSITFPYYLSDSDETTGDPILTLQSLTMTVLDPQYAALAGSVTAYWDEIWNRLQSLHGDYLSDATEYYNSDYHTGYYTFSHSADIRRSDGRIFSFLDEEESYTGGAHGSAVYTGVSFDSATGRRLAFRDVTADYDQVCSAVLEKLAAMNAEEDGTLLLDGYEDTVAEIFNGDEGPEWIIDMDGVTILFNEYVIGPYATGLIEVPLRFAEYPQMFKPEYIPADGGRIRKLMWGYDGTTDVTGDGAADEVRAGGYSAESGDPGCIVSVNGNEAFNVAYASFDSAWLVQDGNGKSWCYVQMYGDNDWPVIDVFDLTGDAPVFTGELPFAVLQPSGGSTERFAMRTRMEFLGSYFGWKDYYLGSDGMPAPYTDYYELYGGSGELTVKTDIPATVYLSGLDSDSGIEATLPIGTVLRPVRTDGSSWMLFEMEDGSSCRVDVDTGESMLGTIGGIDVFDCFDGLFYAG